MSRELSEIAESLATTFKDRLLFEQNNPNDFISNIIREKLQEVDPNYKHYTCEDCGFVVNNKVFHHSHGTCENCGNRLTPIEESEYNLLVENELFTCPECNSKLPRIYKESQHECPVCGRFMDVFVPLNKKKNNKK